MPNIRAGLIDKILWRMAWWENGDPRKRATGSNFDGQLLSLGTLQFAGLAGPLQSIFRDYFSRFPEAARNTLNLDGYPLYEETLAVLPDNLPILFDRINAYPGQVRRDNYIIEPWNAGLVRVAMSPEWQECEKPYIYDIYVKGAIDLVQYYEANSGGDSIATDRCLDLCMDIVCQSGGTNRYPLAETGYQEKLQAIVVAYDNKVANSGWRPEAVHRKNVIVAGSGYIHPKFDEYGNPVPNTGTWWDGQYDDKSMWEVETVPNATQNIGNLPNSVVPPPVQDVWPVQPPATPPPQVNEAIAYLVERAIMPPEAYAWEQRQVTWGELAQVIHDNNKYLWEAHLEKIENKIGGI